MIIINFWFQPNQSIFQKILKFAQNKWARLTPVWMSHLFLFFWMKDTYIWKIIWILLKFSTDAFFHIAWGPIYKFFDWQIEKWPELNFLTNFWKTLIGLVIYVNFTDIRQKMSELSQSINGGSIWPQNGFLPPVTPMGVQCQKYFSW